MKSIHVCLAFAGNCREAMLFYQQCLGGTLNLQTLEQTPLASRMPEKMKKCILHAELKSRRMLLLGSDMVYENGLIRGNDVSLVMHCGTEKELRTCYKKLSLNGIATHPILPTHWNTFTGGLTDKFGHHWILHYDPKACN